MRNWMKRTAIALALVALLAVSAVAADFTHCADALQELGLFHGSEKGFELDRAPTRAEAAAMLVRLLGQEQTAQELAYTAPFTDVPVWAQGYVQYLYNNGMTSGMTKTTFAPKAACTAQMYATFLLRALGYSDQGGRDFTYAKALAFAAEKGVANALNCNEKTFLRDHVVAMSYTALATAPQDGAETNLLQKLMKAGVINDAKGYDKQFRDYAAYSKLAQGDAASTKSHSKAELTLVAAMNGAELVKGEMKLDLLVDMDAAKPDDSKLAMTGTMDLALNPLLAKKDNAMSGDLAYYFTGGVFYLELDGKKLKMPLSLEETLAQLGGLSTQVEPLCLLRSIAATGSGFTVSYAAGSFGRLLDTAMAQAQAITGVAAQPQVDLTKMDAALTVSGGKVTRQTMDMAMEATISGQRVTMNMNMTMTDVGGAVNVVLPADLDTYVELQAPAA